jgi:hypothetical protein
MSAGATRRASALARKQGFLLVGLRPASRPLARVKAHVPTRPSSRSFTATELTPFSGAGQPVETGAAVIVRMATIGKDGPTGIFWENEGELAW